jgi:hypothetical protein
MKTEVKKPDAYAAPTLKLWGTLRELTAGGGGFKKEPGGSTRNTRF